MDEYTYTGNELDVFADAVNWKFYFSKFIKPFLRGNVLEVGAGIGSNTPIFIDNSIQHWTCLEPDESLSARIAVKVQHEQLPGLVSVITGTTADIHGEGLFDAVIYIDVLEHIEHDNEELDRAAKLMKPGGYLIILVPAFNSLYSGFDKEIGHYRRYVKKTLKPVIPAVFKIKKLVYLDSAGFFASLANKLVFRNSKANPKVIQFWDKFLVRISMILDIVLFHAFGKSLVGTWQKIS